MSRRTVQLAVLAIGLPLIVWFSISIERWAHRVIIEPASVVSPERAASIEEKVHILSLRLNRQHEVFLTEVAEINARLDAIPTRLARLVSKHLKVTPEEAHGAMQDPEVASHAELWEKLLDLREFCVVYEDRVYDAWKAGRDLPTLESKLEQVGYADLIGGQCADPGLVWGLVRSYSGNVRNHISEHGEEYLDTDFPAGTWELFAALQRAQVPHTRALIAAFEEL